MEGLRDFRSGEVKAQWRYFMTWYNSRYTAVENTRDFRVMRGALPKEAVWQELKEELKDEARKEWFSRLKRAGLKPDYWIMTRKDEEEVSKVLGDQASVKEARPKNQNLFSNRYGPAWLNWANEADRNAMSSSQPRSASRPRAPSPPAPPPIYPTASQYVQPKSPYDYPSPPPLAPSAPVSFSTDIPLYIITYMNGSPYIPRHSNEKETNELTDLFYKTSAKKTEEFYRAAAEITVAFQRRMLHLDASGLTSSSRKVRESRKHFDNDMRSLAFRKKAELEEVVGLEVKKVMADIESRLRKEMEERQKKEEKELEESVKRKKKEETGKKIEKEQNKENREAETGKDDGLKKPKEKSATQDSEAGEKTQGGGERKKESGGEAKGKANLQQQQKKKGNKEKAKNKDEDALEGMIGAGWGEDEKEGNEGQQDGKDDKADSNERADGGDGGWGKNASNGWGHAANGGGWGDNAKNAGGWGNSTDNSNGGRGNNANAEWGNAGGGSGWGEGIKNGSGWGDNSGNGGGWGGKDASNNSSMGKNEKNSSWGNNNMGGKASGSSKKHQQKQSNFEDPVSLVHSNIKSLDPSRIPEDYPPVRRRSKPARQGYNSEVLFNISNSAPQWNDMDFGPGPAYRGWDSTPGPLAVRHVHHFDCGCADKVVIPSSGKEKSLFKFTPKGLFSRS